METRKVYIKGVIVGKEATNDVSAGPPGPLEGLRIFLQNLPAVEGHQSRALTDSVIPIAHSAALQRSPGNEPSGSQEFRQSIWLVGSGGKAENGLPAEEARSGFLQLCRRRGSATD